MTNAHTLEVTNYRVADLRNYYRNPHVGNVDRIAGSLRAHAQYKPVVVNHGTHTGRPLEVLAGNHTLKAARQLEWERLQGVTVDVDEDQAAQIVLVDNPRPADLGYDDQLLADLLQELPVLDGTGYDPGDLETMLTKLADVTDDAWADTFDGAGGNPDGPTTYTRTFTLHADQAELIDRALEAADTHVTPEHLDLNPNRNGARLTVLAELFTRREVGA